MSLQPVQQNGIWPNKDNSPSWERSYKRVIQADQALDLQKIHAITRNSSLRAVSMPSSYMTLTWSTTAPRNEKRHDTTLQNLTMRWF